MVVLKMKIEMQKFLENRKYEIDESGNSVKVFVGNYAGLLKSRRESGELGLVEIGCNCFQNEFEVVFAL